MGQLEDLQMFVRVVEAGGIGRAAEQMGVAKSAVSRRLAELEARLGARLLNRTTRKSSLTDAGRVVYERAGKVIDDVAEMNAAVVDSADSLEGRLHLAVPLSFGLSHLAPAIDAFARKYPRLTIHLDFSDRHVDLVEEGFDLGFRIADLQDSNLRARRICPIRQVLCGAPEYLAASGFPETPEDLKRHRLLKYSASSLGPVKLYDPRGHEHAVRLDTAMIANNGDFLRDMAVAGHGLVVLPTFIAWRALAAGDLVPVLPGYRLPEMSAYAVYPETRFLSHRARRLIDFLVERFGDNPYWDG